MKENELRGIRFYDALKLKKLYSVGYNRLSAGNSTPVSMDAFTLLYCDGGKISFTAEGKKKLLNKGDYAFIPPLADFFVSVENGRANLFYSAFSAEESLTAVPVGKVHRATAFGKALLSEITGIASRSFGKDHMGAEIPTDALQVSKLFFTAENSDEIALQTLKNCIELFVLESIYPSYKSVKTNFEQGNYDSEGEKLAERITAYLAENTDRAVTLDELSDKLFFSKSYLKAAFKKHTGTTIMRRHNELKIKEAERLLSEGYSVGKVAEKLGFSSQNHFSTVFVKINGITPSQYKKSLKV